MCMWNLPSGLCSSLGESLEYGGGGDSKIQQQYDYNWNRKKRKLYIDILFSLDRLDWVCDSQKEQYINDKTQCRWYVQSCLQHCRKCMYTVGPYAICIHKTAQKAPDFCKIQMPAIYKVPHISFLAYSVV